MTRSDEDIIYELLLKLGNSVKATKAKGKLKSDTEYIQSLRGRIDSEIYYLEDANLLQSELNKYMCKSKNDFMLYNAIKKRHPDLIKPNLARRIDRLVHAIAKQEAIILQKFRIQEPSGNRIDLEDLLAGTNSYKKILTCNIVQVVKELLYDSTSTAVGNIQNELYITETGKKYHIKDCPYCKGKQLIIAPMKMIKNLNLDPCKCVNDRAERTKKEDSYRTIFIDESIHNVSWDLAGYGGRFSSFSYIVCRGNLANESEITEENTLAIDVEYTQERYRTDSIAKNAIGATMILLAFEYNFKGNVKIFTDNLGAMKSWHIGTKNEKLAQMFESVTVQFVPRTENKKADQLGRTQMCLKLPMPIYKQIGDILKDYTELKQENERLKEKERELEDFLNIEREHSLKLSHENNRIKNMSMISLIIERIKYLFQKEHLPVMAVDE
ncbi:hypothetical protein [Pseudobutyrivibrio xylanivorans]|uniref:Uncharacterized protein n=1 Tax=Pseudobutyrivibrio xylanivorans TaxID=185007 RepID=A0A5P6VLF5_PSEXY|nr:hypothetical protein [Pseudobutyrivibrio xylanivorans]QFJ53397.1 hypothetical protein FXF36_00175 [Pseudobutyrivibrio xylanivorans]QFJ53474.1 hypothetical protein FXF36_00585 [Pseudobutyrivibrio xylanivorans]